MSQTISQNLTVNGSISGNSLTCTTGNISNLQTTNLNVSNLQGTISSLTIPTLTSNVHVNSTSVTTPQLFIASKNIGTSVQTLEDNNVVDRQNISALLNKTTNVSYNATTLQTTISGDTKIGNILNQVKISNDVNNVALTIKPGYSTDTIMQNGNVYVATASSTDTINVNNNVYVQGNLQTLSYIKTPKIDVSGNVTSDNAIVNNVDLNSYIATNNTNITNHGSRLTTVETALTNVGTTLTGYSYDNVKDTTVIDNHLKINRTLECTAFTPNFDLVYNPTAISNPPITQGMALGTGDGNTYTTFNLAINSWDSTGFIDTANKRCNVVIDHRHGNIKTLGNVECERLMTDNMVGPFVVPGWYMDSPTNNPRFDKLYPVLGSSKSLGVSSTYEPRPAIDIDDIWIVSPGYYFEIFDQINYAGLKGVIDNRWGTTLKVVSSSSVYNGQNMIASVRVYTHMGTLVTLPFFS